MHPTTLRGVFPDRAVPHKRNFIRENVLRVKTMHQPDLRAKSDPSATVKLQPTTSLPKLRTSENPAKLTNPKIHRKTGIQKVEIHPVQRPPQISDLIVDNNISHRSMQTNTHSEGAVLEPTEKHKATSAKKANQVRQRDSGHGDNSDSAKTTTPRDTSSSTQENVNHVRSNVKALKGVRSGKKSAGNDVSTPPLCPMEIGHKRTWAPKAINRQIHAHRPTEPMQGTNRPLPPCPAGHVLLPDEERRETLRVLRESYAEKISELNSLPVRSDTLKMQRRKFELENELKKIDEGIKIFQRPAVFVKV